MFLLFMDSEANIVTPSKYILQDVLVKCSFQLHNFLCVKPELVSLCEHLETFINVCVKSKDFNNESNLLVVDSEAFTKRVLHAYSMFVNGSALEVLRELPGHCLSKQVLVLVLDKDYTVDEANSKTEYPEFFHLKNINVMHIDDFITE